MVITGCSVDAADHAFYQLVCAAVVKQHVSGTGPLENSGAISSSGPKDQNTSRFSLASHHQLSDTHVNEVNGRLLHKDHLDVSTAYPSSPGKVLTSLSVKDTQRITHHAAWIIRSTWQSGLNFYLFVFFSFYYFKCDTLVITTMGFAAKKKAQPCLYAWLLFTLVNWAL